MARCDRLSRLLPLLAGLASALATRALATPLDFLPPGDPLESELRTLDVLGPGAFGERLRLPHLHMRPLQPIELMGPGAGPEAANPAGAISRVRLERALARDATSTFTPAAIGGVTPRLIQLAYPEDQRFELSAGIEVRAEAAKDHKPAIGSGSGLHVRIAGQSGGFLAVSHLLAGRVEGARTFADPIVPGNDVILHTDESYLAFTPASARWSAQLGRSRWHWGPGEEASLLLSRTAASLTGLALRARIEPLRADGIALSATVDAASGEQLAAHRLEWQPREALRVGIAEAARYHSESWQPLYLAGVVPYVLVQRLLTQDQPDSASSLRNNVVVGVDAAWRVAPGTRFYGEALIDDLHARTGGNPNKYAYQLGWEGAGSFGATRLTWGTEYTRLTRFVYTSSFGQRFAAQGRPLGFPTGPDARRLRVRGAWDLSADWQLAAAVARTDRGENQLDEPFVPGSPRVDPARFEGVVEESRDLELTLRWWPGSGVDLAVLGGYRWVENAAHVAGARTRAARAAASLRLTR